MIKHIKKNEDFQKIYKQGRKQYGQYCLIFFRKHENEEEENTYGFVASKKVGNAVCRNRIKRIFKEFTRKNSNRFPKHHSFVFVAKRRVGDEWKELKYQTVEKDIIRILKKIGKM